MCGLYSFRKSPEETRTLFNYLEEPDFPPRRYVAPGGPIAIVRADKGKRHFALVRWGLVPSWVKEIKPGKPLINARAESVIEKPSFRNAMKRRRCLIPADGFYEWTGDVPGKKQPWFVHRPGDARCLQCPWRPRPCRSERHPVPAHPPRRAAQAVGWCCK